MGATRKSTTLRRSASQDTYVTHYFAMREHAMAARRERVALRVAPLQSERIGWRTQGDKVELFVNLENPGDRLIGPTILNIEAAPLGAFVAGELVGRVPVRALAPKERMRVVHGVARKTLPPADLARLDVGGGFEPPVPPDGMDLVRPTEWAGNLNVWFDTAPENAVELHRALDLSVRAGRRTGIAVYVPAAAADFDVELVCMGAGWSAELLRQSWLRENVALVVVETPVADRRALVHLRVTRRSDERSVLVEFFFRSVDGPGQQLGCMRV
jgi:hypothetical protein